MKVQLITSGAKMELGISPSMVQALLRREATLRGLGDGLVTLTLDLPEHMPSVPCGLYGPVMGDKPVGISEADYRLLPGRRHHLRIINKPVRNSRKITIIGNSYLSSTAEGNVILFQLYTVYGGPLAPKMPNDASITLDQLEASTLFWGQHALSSEAENPLHHSFRSSVYSEELALSA